MPVTLNAYPLEVQNKQIKACVIPYDQEQFDALKAKQNENLIFKRHYDKILVFSSNGEYPFTGDEESIDLTENIGLFCFLVKHGVKKHLSSMGRRPKGFFPIELISSKPDDNLLSPIIGDSYPFQIVVKYELNTRIIKDVPCLVIDSSTRRVVTETCQYFLAKDFDLTNRYVVVEQDNGRRKLLGCVNDVTDGQIHVLGLDGSNHEIHSSDVYLEASIRNFDDYLKHTHGSSKNSIVDRIRLTISKFNGGENKNNRINLLKKYFQSNGIDLIDGTRVKLKEARNIQGMCDQLDRPVFVFNDNGEAKWAEQA